MVFPLSLPFPFPISSTFLFSFQYGIKLIKEPVNELSTTIDLESTLIRAEALFRRFQRTVEAIDKKSSFPAPKLRQRPTTSSTKPPSSPSSSSSPSNTANTSSTDAVSAGGTNSRGRRASTTAQGEGEGELEEQRPKVISAELRELLSRKVEVLPRKVVRRGGEGLSSLKK